MNKILLIIMTVFLITINFYDNSSYKLSMFKDDNTTSNEDKKSEKSDNQDNS